MTTNRESQSETSSEAFVETLTTGDRITIVPTNEASWEDLDTVLGSSRYHGVRCYCQRFKVPASKWREIDDGELALLLRVQSNCDQPESSMTNGLVAYMDEQPVGWCAVEPRTAFTTLRKSRVPWEGRNEDKDDTGVWAITCFNVRKDYRHRGITYALTRAAVEFARKQGAKAIEGYPMITVPEQDIPWGELHVGSHNAFLAAGFREVTRPTKRRVVMRLELEK